MHESPSPARRHTCGHGVGAANACPRLSRAAGRDQVCLQGGGGAAIGTDLGPFERHLGRFEPSIPIFGFSLGLGARRHDHRLCLQSFSTNQPRLTPRPVTQPSDIIAYGPLALLAIGLPGCVTRAARIHLLAPDLCCACLTESRPCRPLTRAEQLCPSRSPPRHTNKARLSAPGASKPSIPMLLP